MTDQEIVEKLLSIKFSEKINLWALAKMMNLSTSMISRIINEQTEIKPSTRRMLEMGFRFYDEDKEKQAKAE